MLAEIDVIGIKDDEVHIFEVKCSARQVKAARQLRKIRALLAKQWGGEGKVLRLFFVNGESGVISAVL
ncbi:hypothetical protein D6783_04170 [Candidatus Woesearchaeota archaeon]|nr:MAG: hypothetical protein D6783_04170 [Candidatus Woesearchaeota archaeon]